MSGGRRLTRVPIQLEVEYRTTGNFLVAYSTNLSKGGLFLQARELLPVGSRVRIRFRVPGVDDTLETEAVVAWVRETPTAEGHPPGMGLEFATLDQAYGRVIDQVVTSFKGLRILIVGEAGAGRALVSRYLRSMLSCDILELTAADTLGAAAQQADVMIVDIDSSGREGLEAIRLTKLRARTPVLALATAEEDRRHALAAGSDDVLALPPTFADLQAALLRALSRPSRVT